MNERVSRADIEFVVQLALSTLSRCGLWACVIGGAAGLVHGIDYRDPKVCSKRDIRAGVDVEEGR
jgi:hypothetical protein